MNISSTICWSSHFDAKTICNVGPDVLCVRQGNLVKFIQMSTNSVSYFKAETVASGLYISQFCGHNRFPLFAFAEATLRPQIFIYKYPELSKFNTLTSNNVINVDMRFTEFDQLLLLSGHPRYTICIFNYRNGNLLLEYDTRITSRPFSLCSSLSSLPTVVQMDKQEMRLLCYEIGFVDKDAFLHLTSIVELGKNYLKSVKHCMCFGDDNDLYVVSDFGEFSQIDIATFSVKPKWSPSYISDPGVSMITRAHSVTSHRNGFLIANYLTAFYIKKKAGNFVVEWTIDEDLGSVCMFRSNPNGELYAQRELGSIDVVQLEENTGKLVELVPTGKPVLAFRVLSGFKEECVAVLFADGIAMIELATGRTTCEIPLQVPCVMNAHRSNPYVIVGTLDGVLVLVHFERSNVAHVVAEVQCESAAVFALDYHDTCVVLQDQAKRLHVVNVEYRPPKMTYFFAIKDDLLVKQVFVMDFLVVEGPRLLVFITRDEDVKYPGYADEMWIYNWGKDRRLHRREFKLPKTYIAFQVQPPAGRWVLVEIVCVVRNSGVFDQYVLNEKNELQLVCSIGTTHFGYIIGMGHTKHVMTWGIAGIMVHFRQHKRAKKPYMMSRYVALFYKPEYLLRARECYNSKYIILLSANNVMRVCRLPSLADNIRENTELPVEENFFIEQIKYEVKPFVPSIAKLEVKEEYTNADLFKHEKLKQMIRDFAAKVTALIDYDISVTGKTKGIYKKFCYHYKWLEALTEQAHKLCEVERASLMEAIADQSRIRDWIMRLVTRDAININYKVRSIFADANFDSFSMQRKPKTEVFDKYRFYDLEDHIRMSTMSLDEIEEVPEESEQHELVEQDAEQQPQVGPKKSVLRELKPYVVVGSSIYEHVMAPVFQLQNRAIVTTNQTFNANCKYRFYLWEPLKQEFNKHFHEAQQMKQETIDNVVGTNNVLNKIYDNMNIMLRLLHMEKFEPPALTLPTLAKDEVIKCIMEVDDSEIKAINRRRRKTIDTGGKRGRLLLWSVEFWARALIVMMDGVIEKLWEEEIKKDIPVPEFTLKKQPHEYSLEDQRVYRAYEEAVRQLEADRRKYLGILHENETKTLALKMNHILKLNKRVAELMLLKLKYDFALKQMRVRMLNLKSINYDRDQLRKRVKSLRSDIDKLGEYIKRYGQLMEFWERAAAEVRTRLDTQQTRDRAIERFFRGNFLNTVPHASHEMTKLFKKRPKLTNKLFPSSMMCLEVAHRLSPKVSTRNAFPLPKDVLDFLANIAEGDLPKQCPPSVDAKAWDAFTKLRRQKIESELRLKGIGYQLSDSQNYLNSLSKDINSLKEAKALTQREMEDTTQQYLEAIHNMTLQITLTLGQVEVHVGGVVKSLQDSVLMHVDDIKAVNAMIKNAGNKKIKAMQRVAIFRRQVIFKEWEHKLYKANIAYLKYMLDAIEKCKVSLEFLTILRNWEKVKAERQKFMAPGAIERVVEQKLQHFANILREFKANILETKRNNHAINLKVERLKVDVAFQHQQRDIMMEERRDREKQERMQQIKTHSQLLTNVRKHYAHVLELQTILELLRLRTYPTLGPPLPQCHPPVPEFILHSTPK